MITLHLSIPALIIAGACILGLLLGLYLYYRWTMADDYFLFPNSRHVISLPSIVYKPLVSAGAWLPVISVTGFVFAIGLQVAVWAHIS